MLNRSGIVGFVSRAISENKDKRATTATVIRVDGNLADIRLEGHATNLANCRITGDPTSIRVGMLVSITWEDFNGAQRPVVQGPGGEGVGLSAGGTSTVLVDNQTIEYSGDGLRVKQGGIGIEHLNFDPATDIGIGDIMPGWSVTDDGILRNNELSLSPYGEITVGVAPNIVKLSSVDADIRLWAGDADPDVAPFSVSKIGRLKSTSAEIGGWEIDTNSIFKSGIDINSVVPAIYVGGANQIQLKGNSAEIIVGNATPNIVIDGTTKEIRTSNFSSGVSGFGLQGSDGSAEFNNVTIRGTIRASVMNIGELSATAGSTGFFKSAGEIYATPAVTPAVGNTFELSVKDADSDLALFALSDVLRIKAWDGSNIIDVWLTITLVTPQTGYTRYTCRVEVGAGVQLRKGMAVVDYGQTDDGHIINSADDTVGASANISISTIATGMINTVTVTTGGSGYTVNDILYLMGGGYNGAVQVASVGASSDVLTVNVYAVGDGYQLQLYNASGGTGTGCQITVDDINGPWDSMYLQARFGNLDGSYGQSGDTYGIGIGNYASGTYMRYANNALTIAGGSISSSSISASSASFGPDVLINEDGIYLDAPYGFSYDTSKIKFVRMAYDWAEVGSIAMVDNLSSWGMDIFTNAKGPGHSGVHIKGDAQSAYNGSVTLTAESGSSSTSSQWFANSSTGTYVRHDRAGANKLEHRYYRDGTWVGQLSVQDATWFRINQDVAKNIYTPRMFAAAGGLVSGSSSILGSGTVGYTGHLRPYRDGSWRTSYTFVPLTTPLTYSVWEGASKTSMGATAVYLNNWGLSSTLGAKAILVRMIARDSATHPRADLYFGGGPTTTNPWAVAVYPHGSDMMASGSGIIPTDPSNNNRIYVRLTSSGSNTMDCWLRIWGYWI